VKRFLGLLGLLALAGCVAPHAVKAQFIGYTSPQTTQQTLATSLPCTGAAQNFPINNLGQTQHYLSVGAVTGATTFSSEIDGLDAQGNVYRISDVLQIPGVSLQRQGTLAASGYFPLIRVSVTCGPNTATFSATYSGAWGTFNSNVGSYLTAAIDKIAFFQVSGTSNASDTMQAPFGNSLGTIYFSQNGIVTTAGTIVVSCVLNLGTIAVGSTLTPTTAAGIQSFSVVAANCPLVNVAYIAGSSNATNISLEYVFTVPGLK